MYKCLTGKNLPDGTLASPCPLSSTEDWCSQRRHRRGVSRSLTEQAAVLSFTGALPAVPSSSCSLVGAACDCFKDSAYQISLRLPARSVLQALPESSGRSGAIFLIQCNIGLSHRHPPSRYCVEFRSPTLCLMGVPVALSLIQFTPLYGRDLKYSTFHQLLFLRSRPDPSRIDTSPRPAVRWVQVKQKDAGESRKLLERGVAASWKAVVGKNCCWK